MTLTPIARIRTPFPEKFGIPRQSGLVDALQAVIVFEKSFQSPEALRGLEDFSHIWLLWGFSEVNQAPGQWSPTVRPPRLGGNARMGVFATRSPYRPNPIGLSAVRLESIELQTAEGPVLRVRGADLMDGTPIYDIKPYLPYADSRPEALGGFASRAPEEKLSVYVPRALRDKLSAETWAALEPVLAQDPRPSYQDDPERVYGLRFGSADVRFTIAGGVLTVTGVVEASNLLPS